MRYAPPCLLVVAACVGDSTVVPPDGGSDAASDSTTPDTAPDTAGEAANNAVNGTVIDAFFQPRPGAKVSIGGTVVTTDTQGKFSFTPVMTPYDAYVADVDPSFQHGLNAWIGLTTRTPVLQDGYAGAYHQSKSVTGTLTGATFPGTTAQRVAVYYDSSQSYHYASSFVAGSQIPGTGAWDAANVTGDWFGSASQAGRVYAALVTLNSGAVVSYDGLGSTAATLTDGQTSSGLTIALTASTSQHNTGNLNLNGLTASSSTPISVYLHPDATRASLQLESVAASGGAIDVTVPAASGMTTTLSVSAVDNQGDTAMVWKARMTPGALFGTIVMPTPIAPVVPADNASNVDATTNYTWSAASGSVVYQLYVYCGANPASFALDVFTTSTSFKLPDAATLSGLSVVYPTATQCLWMTNAVAPATSTDDFAGMSGTLDKTTDFTASADGSKTTTKQRTFTTP